MNLNNLVQFGPWTIRYVHTHFGWKQSCAVSNCSNTTRAQFEVVSPSHRATQTVCSACAAVLAGHDINTLNKADTYAQVVKPQFTALKQLHGMQAVHNHQNKKVIGRLNANIGDNHVFITFFSSGWCMLSINGKPMSPNLNKSIKSKKVAINFAVEVINNKYKDRLLSHIQHGTPFVMP